MNYYDTRIERWRTYIVLTAVWLFILIFTIVSS
jgi:hypothetical protein